MELLDSLTVHHKSGDRYIELYHGDLSRIPPDQAVDILVVSAFPDLYSPTPGTLIDALDRRGVSVQRLSREKAADMRDNFSCWLSRDIKPGMGFKRILCFEPLVRGRPNEVIGDIFISLTPLIMADPTINRIAMPLVATGMQGADPTHVLEGLVDAAVHWLELGLPVTHLMIVEYSMKKALELKGAFSVLKTRYAAPVLPPPAQFKYDLFVSYSHENTGEVLFLLEELQKLRPSIRVFLDRREIDAGASWQQEIYDALDECHKVIAVYSPTYLASKVCKEEFNIALFRHRDSDHGVLIPIYLTSAELPTYMKVMHFIDCREADRAKIRAACKEILAKLD